MNAASTSVKHVTPSKVTKSFPSHTSLYTCIAALNPVSQISQTTAANINKGLVHSVVLSHLQCIAGNKLHYAHINDLPRVMESGTAESNP